MSDETRLDQPREAGRRLRRPSFFTEGAFGTASEAFARFMGTPRFLIGMSIFCAVWLAWNSLAPEVAQFDPRSLNFTLLTLILSLQASYAAPLLLLAQNRQDDRDRVTLEQDRARDERNLADTEFLTREVAALRVALRDVVTRDYLRSELRELIEEMAELSDRGDDDEPAPRPAKKKGRSKQRPKAEAADAAEPGDDGRPVAEARVDSGRDAGARPGADTGDSVMGTTAATVAEPGGATAVGWPSDSPGTSTASGAPGTADGARRTRGL